MRQLGHNGWNVTEERRDIREIGLIAERGPKARSQGNRRRRSAPGPRGLHLPVPWRSPWAPHRPQRTLRVRALRRMPSHCDPRRAVAHCALRQLRNHWRLVLGAGDPGRAAARANCRGTGAHCLLCACGPTLMPLQHTHRARFALSGLRQVRLHRLLVRTTGLAEARALCPCTGADCFSRAGACWPFPFAHSERASCAPILVRSRRAMAP